MSLEMGCASFKNITVNQGSMPYRRLSNSAVTSTAMILIHRTKYEAIL